MRYLYLILAVTIFIIGNLALENLDRHLHIRGIYWNLKQTRAQMAVIATYLHDYADFHGHYPTNDEGLLALNKLVRKCSVSKDGYIDYKAERQVEYCRATSSGVLSLWGDPFIYENRKSLNPASFAHSPAARGASGAYSLKVDKDIYIWSLGAKQASGGKFAYWAPRLSIARYGIALISMMLFIMFVRGAFRAIDPEVRGVHRALRGVLSTFGGILGGMALTIFFLPIAGMFIRTCYAQSVTHLRSPGLTKDYKSLIKKYKDRGIISDKAYKKILAGLEKDKGL